MTNLKTHYSVIHKRVVPISRESPLKVFGVIVSTKGIEGGALYDYAFTPASLQVIVTPLSVRARACKSLVWVESIVRSHYDRKATSYPSFRKRAGVESCAS